MPVPRLVDGEKRFLLSNLKALTYFGDGDLPNLSPTTQTKLRALAGQLNLNRIPLMQARIGVTQRREVPK